MATKNYAATITLGAKVGASLTAAFSKTKREIDALGKEMAKTKGKLDIARELGAARKKFSDSQDWVSGEKSRLKEAQMMGNKKEMREAERALKKAQKEWTNSRKAVLEFTQQARSSGVDITRLSSETKRLGDEFGALDKKRAGLQGVQANFDKLGGAMKTLGGATVNLGNAMRSDFMRTAKVAGLVTAGFIGAGAAAYKMARSFIDSNDDIADTAEALDITVNALKTWQYAASTVGIDAEKFNGAMGKYSKAMDEGNEKTLKVLSELDINFQRIKKLPIGQQMLVIAEKFKNYKGEANKAAMAQALFGRGATQLVAVLNGGADAMEEYYQQAKAAGYILDKDMKEAADEGAKAFDFLGITLKGVKNIIGGALAPAITQAAQALTEFATSHMDDIRAWAKELGKAVESTLVPAVKEFVANLPSMIERVGAVARAIWNATVTVKDAVGGWENLGLIVLGLNFAPTIIAIGNITAALWKLVPAIYAVTGPWGIAAAAAVAAIGLIIANWDKITSKLIEWRETLGRAMYEAKEAILGALQPAFDWIGQKFDWLSEKLRGFVDGVKSVMGAMSVTGPGVSATPSYMNMGGAMTGAGLGGAAAAAMKNAPTAEDTAKGRAGVAPRVDLVPPRMMPQMQSSNGPVTQNNKVDIVVNAPNGNAADIANQIRGEIKRKPLFDMHGALQPQ